MGQRPPNIPEQFLLRTQILYCARGLSPSQKGLRRNFSTNRAVLPDAFKQAFPRKKMPLKAGADPQRHIPRLDGRLAARPLRNVPRPARSGLPMPLYCVRASHSTFSMTVSTRPGAGGLVCKDVAREGRETLSTPSFI